MLFLHYSCIFPTILPFGPFYPARPYSITQLFSVVTITVKNIVDSTILQGRGSYHFEDEILVKIELIVKERIQESRIL